MTLKCTGSKCTMHKVSQQMHAMRTQTSKRKKEAPSRAVQILARLARPCGSLHHSSTALIANGSDQATPGPGALAGSHSNARTAMLAQQCSHSNARTAMLAQQCSHSNARTAMLAQQCSHSNARTAMLAQQAEAVSKDKCQKTSMSSTDCATTQVFHRPISAHLELRGSKLYACKQRCSAIVMFLGFSNLAAWHCPAGHLLRQVSCVPRKRCPSFRVRICLRCFAASARLRCM